ncbi:MAG: alpha/beta hydrolase [Oscillospiraceae bacterium]|nr:alpha/beta hydrolase [Oscillospiraceae bacterium]
MSIKSILFRFICKRGDDKRDAGLVTPADIVRFDDIRYGPDEKANVLDVYRPRAEAGPLPVIVSIHGGGWVYGDKERYQYYCMSLAQYGFVVVNFTYRLAPKHKYPAPLEDTNRVIRWILENADAYGFDTKHVFGVGDSAGAHLLGLYCCLCTNPAFAQSLPFAPPKDFRPKAVALNCGVYRMERGKRRDPLMADLLPQKGTAEELRNISVTEHVTADFPPAFVMTAEGDFLADQALPFTELLQSLGVPAEYHYYGDPQHVLGHVFHCNMRLAEAEQCNRDECGFFRGFLTEE